MGSLETAAHVLLRSIHFLQDLLTKKAKRWAVVMFKDISYICR